ncbi:hypothetical protein [Ancylobacter sp. G4_0304]|uniref:hypothetical protein n=1 Tax=Ancylobacter sp. G4_0304 TaxID=3114289 RepID=UPI0039C73328
MARHGDLTPARDAWTRPSARQRLLAAATLLAAGLALGGCAGVAESLMPDVTKWPEEGKKADPNAPQPAYPTFGAPAQIGDRPVMDAAARAKMQTDLETLAKQREQQLLNDIEQDGGQDDGSAGQ